MAKKEKLGQLVRALFNDLLQGSEIPPSVQARVISITSPFFFELIKEQDKPSFESGQISPEQFAWLMGRVEELLWEAL